MNHKYALTLLLLLPLMACSVHLLDPNPPAPAMAQRFVEHELKAFWQARYTAYLAGEESLTRFLQPFERTPTATLPTTVAEAYQFYFAAVQAADWGNVYLIQSSVEGQLFYLIHVTTDGDDGWIELYGLDGSLLGAARRYLELVEWDDQASLRQQTNTGEFPAALQARFGETLWGKSAARAFRGRLTSINHYALF